MEEYYVENENCIKPLWDWWVFGGRWSGYFTLRKLEKQYPEQYKNFWEEYDKLGLAIIGPNKTEEEQRERSFELFRKYFPDYEGIIPVYRDVYNGLYDDDIVPLLEVYDILKEVYGRYEKDEKEWLMNMIKETGQKGTDYSNIVEYYEEALWHLEHPEKAELTEYSLVYNIEERNAVIPTDPEEIKRYWVAVVDMHF
ncbi:MAG: hypothetical protein ACPLRZ_11450, partial [Thermovenabulum sp.]|uniref:hypothetical protein n=1 Tax=Thermovenabulum sp. TaxID=3100335 RepID=UPI003C79764A